MSKTRLVTVVGIITIIAIAAVSIPLASAKDIKAKPLSLEKIHSGHMPMVSQSIDKAIKAIEAGNKATALAELHKAQKMLAVINVGIAKYVKPKFANDRCPLMGAPINPDKVGKNLIRDYKGQKVAFCCGGCPAAWDKLTDAEKDAKLAKVKPTPKPMKDHSGHKH
jgi:hypothetical protein